jgi:hypothetical protein
MDEEVWDQIGATGVEDLREFGYVVVKKDDVDQLEKKYQSALAVNRNHSKRYEKLLDHVKRMAMGLEHPMGEILDTLINQKNLIDDLRDNVVDLWHSPDNHGQEPMEEYEEDPLHKYLSMTYEEYKAWVEQTSDHADEEPVITATQKCPECGMNKEPFGTHKLQCSRRPRRQPKMPVIKTEDGYGRPLTMKEEEELTKNTGMLKGLELTAAGPPRKTKRSEIDEVISLMSLVIEPYAQPSREELEKLSEEQLEEIMQWCAAMHVAAQDAKGLVGEEPGAAPECLRNLLADDHFYKNWRLESERRVPRYPDGKPVKTHGSRS